MLTELLKSIPVDRLLDALAEQTMDAIIISEANPPYRALYCNDAYTRLTGYSADEIVNKPVPFQPNLDLNRAAIDEIKLSIGAGKPARVDLLNHTKDGRPFWVCANVSPISSAGSSVTHLIATMRDITERRRAELEKATTAHFFAAIFSLVDRGVSVIDDEGRVMMINAAFTRLFGWRQEQLVGKPFTAYTETDDPAEVMRRHRENIAGGAPYTKSFRVRGPDGTSLPTLFTSTVVTTSDSRRYRVAVLRPEEEPPLTRQATPAPSISIIPAREAASPPPAPARHVPPATPMPFGVTTTAQRVATEGHVAKERRIVTAGRVQLVGLLEVKAALGERWPELAAKAFRLAENVVGRRIAPNDTMTRTDEGIVVCFASLSEEEARLAAAALAEEIQRRLLGEVELPSPATTTASSAVVVDIGEKAGPDEIAETAELKLRAAKTSGFAATVELDPATGRHSSIGGAPAGIAHAIEAKLTIAQADGARRAHDLLRLSKSRARIHIEAVFSSAAQRVPLALVQFRDGLGGELEQVARNLPHDPRFIVDMNILVLNTAANHLVHTVRGEGSLYLVPVDFDVFMNRRTVKEYVDVCRALPQPVSGQIVFELKNLPPGVGQTRIEDTVQLLSSFGRGVSVELTDIDVPALDPSRYRLPIVTIANGTLFRGGELRRDVAKLAQAIHLHKGRLLVKNVASGAELIALRGAGIDLMTRDRGKGENLQAAG